jgi:hypothetical protein
VYKLSAEVVEGLTSVHLQIPILVPSVADLVIVLKGCIEGSKHLLVRSVKVLVTLLTSITRVKVLVSVASSSSKEVSHIGSCSRELGLIFLKLVDY